MYTPREARRPGDGGTGLPTVGAGSIIDRRLPELEHDSTRHRHGAGTSSSNKEAALKKLAGLGVVMVLALVASSAAWADTSGPQSFTVIQLNEQQARVFAGGPIAGAGVDVVESEEESPDGTIHFVDRFVFGRGSVTVAGTGTASGDFDERTCIGRRHLSGSFQIVGGTDRFSGASGGGRWTGEVTFVLRRSPDGCADEELFSTVIFRFTGTASIAGNAA